MGEAWDHAAAIVKAAASIVDSISRLMNARDGGVERVAEVLPDLRIRVEKVAADTRAAIKYGRTAAKPSSGNR